MNNIIAKNITLISKEKKSYIKTLKNFNCEIDIGKITSFISEEPLAKKSLANIFLEKKRPSYGKLISNNENIYYISNKKINDLIKENRIVNKIIFNPFENDKKVTKKILKEKLSLEYKLRKMEKKYSILITKDFFYKIIKSDENNYFFQWLESDDSILSKNKKNILLKNILLKNMNICKTRLKKLNASFLFRKKTINIDFSSVDINLNMKFRKERKTLNQYRKKEINEIEILSSKLKSNDRQQKEIIIKLKNESINIVNFIKNINIPGFTLSKKDLTLINKMSSKNSDDDWLQIFKKVIIFFDELSLVLENKISNEIILIKKYIQNIQNHASALNTVSFNLIFNKSIQMLKKKIIYCQKIDLDIDKKIISIQKKDKMEKNTLKRKLWEFKIISLRFQKQIYSDKKEILKKHLLIIKKTYYLHSKENLKEFYISMDNYLKENLLVEISMNSWLYNRKLKENILKFGIEKNTLLSNILTIRNKITKFDLLNKKNIESIHKKRLLEYKLFIDSKEKKDKFFLEFEKYINLEIINLKKNISLCKKNILLITNNINFLTEEEKESQMLGLLEDINFNLEDIGMHINTLLESKIQRILIIRAIMLGYRILMIENLKSDISKTSKSSIENSISIISKKYGITFIIFTKDLDSAMYYSNNIYFIENGTSWEWGSVTSLLKKQVHPATQKIFNNAEKIKFMNKETNFIRFSELNLYHNEFTQLEIYPITKNHNIFCSNEEWEKWRLK